MSRTNALSINVRAVGEVVVVSPAGTLEAATAPQLRSFLLTAMADQPSAVIVDLRDLTPVKAQSLSVFAAVAQQAARWTGLPLILVTGSDRARELEPRSAMVARFLPVFRDLPTALGSLGATMSRQVTQLHLFADVHSAAVARRFVAGTCELWRCEELAEKAIAITSELVANAVLHAGTDSVLRLELRRQLLTVAVTDGDPTFAGRSARRPDCFGLAIVRGLATDWGASPTSTGGKVVWATIRLRTPDATAVINNAWRQTQ